MLQHIKPRDVIEFFLFGLILVALVALSAFLEVAPISLSLVVALVLGVALWITWFILVVRQRAQENRRPKLKIMTNGKWVDVESPEGIAMVSAIYASPRRPVQLFDQDNPNDKETA